MSRYDPWGPISSTLYSINDSELVENVVGFTGLKVPWPVLDDRTGYSHRTRIRAYKPVIQAAYDALEDEEKGKFAKRTISNATPRSSLNTVFVGLLSDLR